jgi:hypothetical protein
MHYLLMVNIHVIFTNFINFIKYFDVEIIIFINYYEIIMKINFVIHFVEYFDFIN